MQTFPYSLKSRLFYDKSVFVLLIVMVFWIQMCDISVVPVFHLQYALHILYNFGAYK